MNTPSTLPDDVVLSVRNVSKKFCRNLRRSMLYGMKELGLNLLGVGTTAAAPAEEIRKSKSENRNPAPISPLASRLSALPPASQLSTVDSQLSTFHHSPLRPHEFWALQNISFDLKRGGCLGLIGDNGAGKTTMLRLITGIFPPDAGEIALRGRLGALIALGAGFHPHMTGRENIYLNGSILGMSRAELNRKMDEIVDFAEIGEFLEAPVSTYSSGMRVRLGFGIAVHTDPDLLLVDEVLAVGDYNFQEKCMRKMDQLLSRERAVILVTHSLYRIESFCSHAIWMEHGASVMDGDALSVVRSYLDAQEKRTLTEKAQESNQKHTDDTQPISPITLTSVEVVDAAGCQTEEIPFGSPMTIRIAYHAHKRIDSPLFNLRIFHRGHGIVEASMLIDGTGPEFVVGDGIVDCRFEMLPLTPKVYDIVVFVRSGNGAVDLCPMRTYASFRITDETLDRVPLRGPYALNHLRQGSPVYLPRNWSFFKDGRLTSTITSAMTTPNIE